MDRKPVLFDSQNRLSFPRLKFILGRSRPMVRILRSSPVLLFALTLLHADCDLQAKPPELPATPNDQCLIPAIFDPNEWVMPFSFRPLDFRVQIPQTETTCMPAEVEALTVPPREITIAPTTLRRPDLPVIDPGLILGLEKVEQKLESSDARQWIFSF
jgi:hypothetical protein